MKPKKIHICKTNGEQFLCGKKRPKSAAQPKDGTGMCLTCLTVVIERHNKFGIMLGKLRWLINYTLEDECNSVKHSDHSKNFSVGKTSFAIQKVKPKKLASSSTSH